MSKLPENALIRVQPSTRGGQIQVNIPDGIDDEPIVRTVRIKRQRIQIPIRINSGIVSITPNGFVVRLPDVGSMGIFGNDDNSFGFSEMGEAFQFLAGVLGKKHFCYRDEIMYNKEGDYLYEELDADGNPIPEPEDVNATIVNTKEKDQ